ncbi:non-ribosomal peptide synthetase [Clostridium felsineum]|uniref:non-ribosomal peptide synthetase n=1 Tax=Clostridium felsineum TaxID=36839 RepID=UPI00098C6677|nr:non-ribosomal peptide synthetase [Clostridium felsineum]URZ17241.1 Plipastatin synthase subunit A [Clostridium felsineum DSM 794]
MDRENTMFDLTHAQKRIWYMDKLFNSTGINNLAPNIKIENFTDLEIMKKAINITISQNDAIRIRIIEQNDIVKQYIKEYEPIKIEYFDFADEMEAERWMQNQAHKPFILEDSDLFYFAVGRFNKSEYVLFMKIHHIVADVWGMSLIINQIIENYNLLVNETNITVDKRPSYLLYVERENYYKHTRLFIDDKNFWLNKFETLPNVTKLKQDKLNVSSMHACRKGISVPEQLNDIIYKFCELNKTSVFRIFMASFFIYISRITCSDDICIGTLIHNRFEVDEKEMVGMFASTVPFRVKVDENLDFIRFLAIVTKEFKDIMKHQKYPYDLLIDDLRKKHNGVMGLFNVLISYQNAQYCKGVETKWNFSGYEENDIAIHINSRKGDGKLRLEIDYNIDIFSQNDIKVLFDRVFALMNKLLTTPHQVIKDHSILSNHEENLIIKEFNNTDTKYEQNVKVHELFERQVKRNPDSIAVSFKNKSITYKQLNKKSNQLANLLVKIGVKSDVVVGLMVERSIDMIIGILAVFKAGGAYLPIDSTHPVERIKYILENSHTNILLTQKHLKNKFAFDGHIVDIQDESLYSEKFDDLNLHGDINDLAYVIYTSGSTGKPKGVMIEEKSLINFINAINQRITLQHNDRIVALTTISFDISILEIILPLTKGLEVVIASEEEKIDPKLLRKLIIDNNVKIFQTTPSRLQLLINSGLDLDFLNNLEVILIGGEALHENILVTIKNYTKAKIYNMYGPTETTIWSTIKELTNTNEINIGKPIANTQIYIVDKNNNLQPIRVNGELCISGDCVSRGYLNNDKLTKTKFVTDIVNRKKIMYKTGDCARWLENGDIEFVGRLDNQIKVRGYRIELDEIEKSLNMYSHIKNSAVIAKEGNHGDKYLVSYYTSNVEIDNSKIYAFLSNIIPDYMIPHDYIRIDKFPLTPNGKINKKALLSLEIKSSCKDIKNSLFESGVGKDIYDIWVKILNKDNIRINDRFFEIGGDSLSLVAMHAEIEKKYPGKISVTDIFANPTLYKVISFIEKQNKLEVLKTNMDYIEFPKSYYLNSGLANSCKIITTEIDKNMFAKLNLLCEKINVNKMDIIFSIYVYTLAKTSNKQNINIHYSNISDKAFIVNVDLNKFKKFNQLIKAIGNDVIFYSNEQMDEKLLLECMPPKLEKSILPLFVSGNNSNDNIENFYDVILKTYKGGKKIVLSFKYNCKKLNSEKIEEFFYQYLKLLEVIINNEKWR